MKHAISPPLLSRLELILDTQRKISAPLMEFHFSITQLKTKAHQDLVGCETLAKTHSLARARDPSFASDTLNIIEAHVPVPTFTDMVPPLLNVLAAHSDGNEVAKVYAMVAEAVGLTEEEKAQMVLSKSQAVYKNRIGWAHDSRKRLAWSSSPRYGVLKDPSGEGGSQEETPERVHF